MIDHTNRNIGQIVAMQDNVIDMQFSEQQPALHNRLIAKNDINIEVVAHISETDVRGIALNSTQGLSRGTEVT